MTPVAAINEHSCALACLESVLRDNFINTSQKELIQKHYTKFPKWIKKPGLLNPQELVFLSCIELGIQSGFEQDIPYDGKNEKDIINSIKDPKTLATYLVTSKYYNSDGSLGKYNHCKRVGECLLQCVELMNPNQKQPENKMWNWQVVVTWEPFFLIVKCPYLEINSEQCAAPDLKQAGELDC